MKAGPEANRGLACPIWDGHGPNSWLLAVLKFIWGSVGVADLFPDPYESEWLTHMLAEFRILQEDWNHNGLYM